MTTSSLAIAKRLRALEAERSRRHPDRLLVLLGVSEASIVAQFNLAVAEGRADGGEPVMSILMVPGVGTREVAHAQAH
jgi:hypothetical protein